MSNVEKYKEFRTRLKNLTYACNVLAFDEATVCPKLDKENSMNVYNYFAIEADKIATSDEYYNLVKELNNNPSGLDDIEIEMIKKELKELTKQRKIPSDLRELGYQYLQLLGEKSFIQCQECGILMKRKNKNDFSTKCCSSCMRIKNYERKRNSFYKLDKA